MNVHVPRPASPASLAAEGLPRRSWTVSDVDRMLEAGIIDRRERFELIGGEIVPMSPKGRLHELVKKELNRFWTKAINADIDILPETTLYVGERDFLEPDFIFWPRSMAIEDIRPAELLLVVEVADSSLSYDLGRKAQIYSALGVRDYWAIDAVRMLTHIHRLAESGAEYRPAIPVPHTERATPLLVPDLAVRLADLGLEPMAA